MTTTKPIAGSPRWRLLETVRAYAFQRLEQSGETPATLQRQLAWLATFMEALKAGLEGPDGPDWLVRADAEMPNLRTVIQRLGRPSAACDDALRCLAASRLYWLARGRLHEAAGLFNPLLPEEDVDPSRVLARALFALAYLNAWDYDGRSRSQSLLIRSIEMSRRVRDEAGLGLALAFRGMMAPGAPADTSDEVLDGWFEEAIESCRASEDVPALAEALLWPGRSLGRRGDPRAEALLEESAALSRQLGFDICIGWAEWDLATISLRAENLESGTAHASVALEACARMPDAVGIGATETLLAAISEADGRAADAARHRSLALGAMAPTGFRSPGELFNLAGLMQRALGIDDYANAAKLLGAFESLAVSVLPEAEVVKWADFVHEMTDVPELRSELRRLGAANALTDRFRAEYEWGLEAPLTDVVALVLELDWEHGAGSAVSGKTPRPDGLTEREAEVLAHIAAGLTNDGIAAQLVLSRKTVERHISNLYPKIGARGRADATAYALRNGLTGRD